MPASTSTTAPAPSAKVQVRRKEVGLTADTLDRAQELTTVDGRVVHASRGDIRIGRGEHVIDVLIPRHFAERFEVVVPSQLTLSPADCAQLEATAGLGSTQSAAALVKAVQRLCTIAVGEIRIPFTPGQVEELKHRAQKRGRTLDAEIRAVIARLQDELFYKGG